MREKFELTVEDHLAGLQIFASQRKLDEFYDLFNQLTGGEKAELSQNVFENIGKNLMIFDSDKEKQRRLEMADRLHKKAIEQRIILSPNLFDSLVNIFTETQNWRSVIDLLTQSNPGNC